MTQLAESPKSVTTLYIDGNCPFCSREAAWLCRRKGGEGVQIVDIAGPDFDPSTHGLQKDAVHRQLHARRADGSLVVGWKATIEALRSTGSGKWTQLLYLPGVRHALDLGYRIFARNRVAWGNALLRWFPRLNSKRK